MVIRGAEEPKPKLTIHVPATPVSETPPSLPTPIAMSAKSAQNRPIKIINRKSSLLPSTPTATPAKLRLPSAHGVDLIKASTAASPVATPKHTKHATVVATPRPAPIVKKKEKPLPKAQSSGMSVNDLKACRNAIKKLMAFKHSVLFRQPVDPVRDRAPKYYCLSSNVSILTTSLIAILTLSKTPLTSVQ